MQKESLRLIGDCESYYDYGDSDGNDNGDDNDYGDGNDLNIKGAVSLSQKSDRAYPTSGGK